MYDRVVVPEELTPLAIVCPAHRPLVAGNRLGWRVPRGRRAELKLGAGATIFIEARSAICWTRTAPRAVRRWTARGPSGARRRRGYAATEGPVVDTTDSFSIAVRVRLCDREPAGPMTVLSQAGEHTNAFRVRYEPAEYRWQLVMPNADEPGATETVVASIATPDGGEGGGSGSRSSTTSHRQDPAYLDGFSNTDPPPTSAGLEGAGGLPVDGAPWVTAGASTSTATSMRSTPSPAC